MASKESLRTKVYRLTDNRSGESVQLSSGRKGKLSIYDEGTKRRRAIRHCPNQRSVFIDEQDEHAYVEPIIFLRGILEATGDNPITQEFLDHSPHNVANGGSWFELEDDEKEAKKSIQLDELKTDLKVMIRDKAKEKDGIHALKAEVSVILGSVDDSASKGIEELKQILYNKVEENPEYFTDDAQNPIIFDDDFVYRKYVVLKSLKDGVIKKSPSNKSIVWNDNSIIATAPIGRDLVDFFTEFLESDEGMLVMEEIARKS